MDEPLALWLKAITSILGMLGYNADYVETLGKIEKLSGHRTSEYSKLWVSEENIKALEKEVGPEKAAKMAILLLRLANAQSRNVMEMSPDDKFKTAQEIRTIVKDFDEFFHELPFKPGLTSSNP